MASAVVLGLSPLAHAGDPPEVGLAGNDVILWAYQHQTEPDGTVLLRFAHRGSGTDRPGRFAVLPIALQGRVRFGAVRGTSLHVFYEDGTHRRCVPRQTGSGTIAQASWFGARALPDSALPAAVGVDEPFGLLLAVVSARQADQIEAEAAAIAARAGQGEETPGEDGEPESEPATVSQPQTDRVIVRYENGQWTRDRSGPADLTVEARIVQLLAADGVVHLISSSDRAPAEFVHRFSTGPSQPWSDPVRLPLEGDPVSWAGGWVESVPVLVVAERAGGPASRVRSLSFKESAWEVGAELTTETGAALSFDEPPALALFEGRIAVATVSESGNLQVGIWAPDTGRPMEPTVEVKTSALRPSPPAGGLTNFLVQTPILVGIFVVVFVWRRDSVTREAELLPTQRFARLGRRAVALLVDLTILSPVWGPIVYKMWRDGAPELTFQERWDLGDATFVAGLYWSKALVGGVLGIYAAVLEAATGTTPGKRIVGLSVVGDNGCRAGVGPILARNLARVIEFHFIPVALLVVFTPSRLRLGDLLATTVVVEPAVPPDNSSETPDNSCDHEA